MPRGSKTDLFRLIKTMSKGEKRFFKLYAVSRSASNQDLNYLTLFDAIEKQKAYDEQKIKRLGLVRDEHLPMLKNYLYNLVLASLRVLRNKSKDADTSIANLLENARIMRDRGLEEESLSFLAKARDLALKYERWGPALESLFMERKVLVRTRVPAPWRALDKEIATVIDKLNNLVEYYFINREVQLLTIRPSPGAKITNRELKRLMANPLLKSEAKGLSLEAKRTHYLTLCNYYSHIGEHEKSHEALTNALQLLEKNFEIFESPDMTYAMALSNLIIIQFNLRKYQEAYQSIKKYRAFARKGGAAASFTRVYSGIFETYYYIRTADFGNGLACITDIERDLSDMISETEFPAQVNFLNYNIAHLYFGAGEYRKALNYVITITRQPKSDFREDMQAFARILQLLIYFELKDTDIIEYQVVSAYRFLLKRKQLFGVEKSLLSFMRRISKKNLSDEMLLKEFIVLRDELTRITRKAEEKEALDYFDIIAWLDSKIQRRPFSEIAKEKYFSLASA